MYPNTVFTAFGELSGSSAQIYLLLATTSNTRIVGATMSQSSNTFETQILCIRNGATTTALDNYNSVGYYTNLSIRCNGNIGFQKTTGNGNSFVNVMYIPEYYDATATAPVYNFTATTTVGTSTTYAYTGLNYQETLFISAVLLFLLSLMAWGRIFTVKAKNI